MSNNLDVRHIVKSVHALFDNCVSRVQFRELIIGSYHIPLRKLCVCHDDSPPDPAPDLKRVRARAFECVVQLVE